MSLDEMRKQIRSKIQVNDCRTARNLFFPPRAIPVFSPARRLIWLVWTGVIVLLICKHAPPLLPLVAGAADLLMTIFLVNLWFHRSHVVQSRRGR
jgi:hypothetical protein